MRVQKNIDHFFYGVLFAILGTLLGIALVESYFLTKGHKLGVFWSLFNTPEMKSNLIILSQVPNVFVFYLFFQSKRDRSAYGALAIIILSFIPAFISMING